MNEEKKKFDLEERTGRFGECVIDFCGKIKQDAVTRPLISQIVRSATSIGANYMEAEGASSKKDFKNKIHICKKEAQETVHWLRMFEKALITQKEPLQSLRKEAAELTLIFGKIISTMNKNV